MQNKYILESLASDLKRVALGIHRGSYAVSDRFSKEALRRKEELDLSQLPPYIQLFLNSLATSLKNKNKSRRAEDALMYSTLFQNYVTASK